MNFSDIFSKIRKAQPRPEEAPTHWVKCDNCHSLMYYKEVEACFNVCPKCGYHMRLKADDRINLICDEGSFVEFDANLKPVDPLNFVDKKSYKKRITENKNVLVLKYYRSGVFVEENQGFIAGILDAIENRLQKENLNMVLRVHKESFEKFLSETDLSQYEGIILIGTEFTPELYPLFDSIYIPYVVVDNVCPYTTCNSVCMNNEENVYIAIDYLKQCGHKSIGYIGGNIYSENFQLRKKGFIESVERLEMDYVKEHTYMISPTMIGAYNDMLEQLGDLNTLPDCFFADNDTLALGAIKALKEKGKGKNIQRYFE